MSVRPAGLPHKRDGQPARTSGGAGPLLPDLLAARAARTPHRVAISAAGEDFTCAGLQARANRLAGHLQARGAGPGALVAVVLERGPALVPALLGVLASGAAYVPLDPEHPADRLAFIVRDAGARIVLTQRDLAGRYAHAAPEVVTVEDAVEHEPASAPATAIRGEDLAYVIYTSGSTGRPKGVMIRHAALANLLLSMRERPGLGPDDVLVTVTTVSFDMSVPDLYLPLLVGARMVMAGRAEAPDAERLAELLDRSGATVLQATPATWRLLLGTGWRPPAGFTALCGGERLPPDLAARLAAAAGEAWDLYGPTETTVWSGMARLDARGRPHDWAPVARTSVHVLDEAMVPVGDGEAGEVYIGGQGLARGYLGQPALTAERFLPDPFAGAGARLYRTGDVGRRHPAGRVEILGRTDHQVKVRGHRIELGEVENVLLEHPGVRDAVVAVHGQGEVDARLVAYVVPAGAGAEAGALREHLARRLPRYMLPAVCVRLERLPLNPSGKVDRAALPPPPGVVANPSGEHAPARSASERLLAAAWAEALDLDRVGVHDDFFEIGGDSIRAARIVARARAGGLDVTAGLLFANPTVASLAAVAGDLDRSQAPGGAGEVAAPGGAAEVAAPPALAGGVPVAAGDLEDAHALTPSQEGILFHALYRPGQYVVQECYTLSGPLDAGRLRSAWQRVVDRHPALRSTFHWRARPEPVQVVHRRARLPLGLLDWTGAEPSQQRERLERLLAEHRERGFDLPSEPPFRVTLVRLDARRHWLLHEYHHIALDGWSGQLVVAEVGRAYGAGAGRDGAAAAPADPVAGERDLPEPARFREFVEWRAGRDRRAEERFWRSYLRGSGEPTPLAAGLAGDGGAAGGAGGGVGVCELTLDREHTRRLEALGRRAGFTLSTLLRGVWALLLSRQRGARTVTFGVTVSGRSPELAGTDRMVGMLLNTLPVRIDVPEATPFARWLAAVERDQAALRDFEQSSLVDVQSWSEVPAGTPLFDSIVVVETYPDDADAAAIGAAAVRLDETREETGYPVTVVARPGERLSVRFLHEREHLPPALARHVVERFRRVLEVVGADPHVAVGAIDALGPAERRLLLHGHEATGAGHGPAVRVEPGARERRAVHEVIAGHARRRPGAVALRSGGSTLTYGELDARAGLLAGELRRAGVGPERLVAVALERSPDLVVALLATLRAGGAYVPLDPAQPVERLRWMVSDAGAGVVLTTAALREGLDAGAARVMSVDGLTVPRGAEPVAGGATGARAEPSSLAYVIYTSGSTGRPKGVCVEHRNLAHYLSWAAAAYATGGRVDTVLHSSVAFDLAVTSLFLPLYTGGTLTLAPAAAGGGRQAAAVAEVLLDVLAAGRDASFVKLTPAHMDLVAAAAGPGTLACEVVVVGGEQLHGRTVATWLERARTGRIVNEYGPTEATVGCCVFTHPGGRTPPAGPLPIGRAIADTRLYVLDGRGRPVPLGATGELFIGGAGVARGYHARPALTAERFVPDPFGPGRLYRTGDLVRWRGDGQLEFLGRRDQQVKLGGHRVELGEIEAVLLAHPLVREAAVVARDGSAGEARLVAYVVPAGEVPPEPGDVRNHLARYLPEYMLPAALAAVERIPLTPGGKVDRAALPDVEASGTDLEQPHVPPRSEVELELADIFSEVLGLERIGVLDDFFDLGGHSLQATRVVTRIRERLGRQLPLPRLFDTPTIAELAPLLEEAGAPE